GDGAVGAPTVLWAEHPVYGKLLPTECGSRRRLRRRERVKGIEPSSPAWKAGTLPLSYTRVVGEGGFEPPTACPQSRCATTAPLPVARAMVALAGCRIPRERDGAATTLVSRYESHRRAPRGQQGEALGGSRRAGVRTGARPGV